MALREEMYDPVNVLSLVQVLAGLVDKQTNKYPNQTYGLTMPQYDRRP